MKVLIIVSHPNMSQSLVHKEWIKNVRKYPQKYTIHHLEEFYPDGKIDMNFEQRLVESHDKIIFQFPVYWFNCPPLLKKWLDVVLTHGWAYGKQGNKLTQKKIALIVSAGIKKEDYSLNGRYIHRLEDILLPFEMTFRYCNAEYHHFFAFYGTETDSVEANELLQKKVELSKKEFIDFINSI